MNNSIPEITKEKAGHTPGPWKVRDNKNGTLGIDAFEPDGTPCQPARINGDADDDIYGPATRANANLIAAAPDLLTTAKELNVVSAAAMRAMKNHPGCWDEFMAEIHRLGIPDGVGKRAAGTIARAEGGAK